MRIYSIFTSFCIMPSRSISVVAKNRIYLFYGWIMCHCVCVCVCVCVPHFFSHSYIVGHILCFYVLTAAKNTVISMGVQVCLAKCFHSPEIELLNLIYFCFKFFEEPSYCLQGPVWEEAWIGGNPSGSHLRPWVSAWCLDWLALESDMKPGSLHSPVGKVSLFS